MTDTLRILEELRDIRGAHTSLITYILEAGAEVSKKRHKIVEEIASSANIKDKRNRKNVQSGLKSIQERLLLRTQTKPQLDTGMAIFAGSYI